MRVALLLLLTVSSLRAETNALRVVHAFVCLCDNASQSIWPKVPPRIGNGNDPGENLYWGCDDGLRSVFQRSARWKSIPGALAPGEPVLERRLYRHVSGRVVLVADAYRGSEMVACLREFFLAASGHSTVLVPAAGSGSPEERHPDAIAFLGHDGLMEHPVPALPSPTSSQPRDAFVFCCISRDYFGPPLRRLGVTPRVTTTQLMYPGAFLLHDVLDGWLSGESPDRLRQRAAAAYARNQRISLKAAAGVFAAE